MTKSAKIFLLDELPSFNSPNNTQEDLRRTAQIFDDLRLKFRKLPSVFVQGRNTARVPSSATDVQADDRLGDVVNDATYEYKLVEVSGVLKWDRRALSVGW